MDHGQLLNGRPNLNKNHELTFVFSTKGLFADNHILNMTPNKDITVYVLKNLAPQKTTLRRLKPLIPIIHEIIKNHPRRSIFHWLNRLCPTKDNLDNLAISPSDVFVFVKSVVSTVFPLSFFGSKKNQRAFWKILNKWLSMGDNGALRSDDLLADFNISDCAWLVPSFEESVDLMGSAIFWLLNKYITQLIRTCFYVTKPDDQEKRLFFYRHDDWLKMNRSFIFKSLNERYELVDEDFVKDLTLGSSPIWAVPKKTGFRLLTNLSKAMKQEQASDGTWVKKVMDNNKVLENILFVLNFEVARQSNLWEDRITNQDDIVARLANYKDQVLTTSSVAPCFYFSKVDIKQCFDTINQQKLLELLEYIFKDPQYSIHKYQVIKWRDGKIIYDNLKAAIPFGYSSGSLSDYDMKHAPRSMISVDEVECDNISLQSIRNLLEEHVKNNTVIYEDKIYRQKQGISQGSVLSPMLSNLYLEEMMKNKLRHIYQSDAGVLIRYADDLLFVSTNKALVYEFDTLMTNGFDEYGCYINIDKKQNNLDGSTLDISFCGLKISALNLNILPK